ncbi:beta/alpha barrel domain-containing protein [Neolewinella antarctica]|uniref:Isopentenyl-diphosphate delta-isomerase n=1 Tax=Neolewinella antarctica TaxID=442734 RepID=A0ABX0XE38_9BACT|nr:isopentenyl-diphosphate delta-isomerase [Neolewinella antarctica]NJC27581.1 isopentenyl-diphosphate delta-isomerase [Neolewinella antarctica]
MPAAPKNDPTAPARKEDHIELAFRSQVEGFQLDPRFDYEPLLAAHPAPGSLPPTPFGDKQLAAPIWVSSMTGGTEKALVINHNLARACAEFGLGMGLGSCRPLLYDNDRLKDFDVRPLTGPDVPLYANLGVAQIEDLLDEGRMQEIQQMVDLLRVDGLIIHVNPLQEAMQPEGDMYRSAPIDVIKATLAALPGLPVIVKEVGQGMGPRSIHALLDLPLLALDTAAGGGTNFSKLELFRGDDIRRAAYEPLVNVGHTAEEMVEMVNGQVRVGAVSSPKWTMETQHLIVSGGVRTFLDGYYLTERSTMPAIYGQASAFLKFAREDYALLQRYVATQIRGLELAHAYLRVRSSPGEFKVV